MPGVLAHRGFKEVSEGTNALPLGHLMELQKEHPEKLVPAPEAEVAGKTEV